MSSGEVAQAVTPSTHQDICTFCDELAGRSSAFIDQGLAVRRDDYVLWESEDFAVVPCLGALSDWYVLVVPKQHVLSCAFLDEPCRDRLRSFVGEATRRLRAVSGTNVVQFEHGSLNFRNRGGSCQDHAHLHLVATGRPAAEFVRRVEGLVALEPTADWLGAAADTVRRRATAYLALTAGGQSYLADATGAPSQFFRRTLCDWLGAPPGAWDWLVFPQLERSRLMLDGRELYRSV